MKKWFIISVLSLSLVACGGNNNAGESNKKEESESAKNIENVEPAVDEQVKEDTPTGFTYQRTDDELSNDALETLLIDNNQVEMPSGVTATDEGLLLSYGEKEYVVLANGSWMHQQTFGDEAGELEDFRLEHGMLYKRGDTGVMFYNPFSQAMLSTSLTLDSEPSLVETSRGVANFDVEGDELSLTVLEDQEVIQYGNPKDLYHAVGQYYDVESKNFVIWDFENQKILAFNTENEEYVYDDNGEEKAINGVYDFYNASKGDDETTYILYHPSKDAVSLMAVDRDMNVLSDNDITSYLNSADLRAEMGNRLALAQNDNGSEVYVYEVYENKSVPAVAKHIFSYENGENGDSQEEVKEEVPEASDQSNSLIAREEFDRELFFDGPPVFMDYRRITEELKQKGAVEFVMSIDYDDPTMGANSKMDIYQLSDTLVGVLNKDVALLSESFNDIKEAEDYIENLK